MISGQRRERERKVWKVGRSWGLTFTAERTNFIEVVSTAEV